MAFTPYYDLYGPWSTAGTSTNWAHYWIAPAAREVAAPALRGLKLARAHLAALLEALPPGEPARPRTARLEAPRGAWATSREHRLRPGHRRRARPAWSLS